VNKNIKIIGLVGLLIALGLFGLRLINNTKTTTPEEFINSFQVNRQTLDNDKQQVVETVDSLISLQVIYKSAEKALRYFDGKTYEDTVDRQWAIDLPMKSITYVDHYVDTIFYKPDDKNVFSGTLISKTQNRLAKNGIEYVGNGFVCKRVGKVLKLKIEGYRVTGSETIDVCSDAMHEIYFREMGLVDSSFNLNDKRFWTTKEVTRINWD
jgi:hypothetical protein